MRLWGPDFHLLQSARCGQIGGTLRRGEEEVYALSNNSDKVYDAAERTVCSSIAVFYYYVR